MNVRRLWLVVLWAFLASPAAGAEVMRWTVDGVERQALVFPPNPPVNAGGRVPVVLAFHGHFGDMREAAEFMAFHEAWPGALVVYPQGLPTAVGIDPQGLYSGWQHDPGQNGDRDLKFVDAVLATLRQKYPVDDRRLYVTGFSNGASFTYLLWAERAKTFAAFAPVAGLIEAPLTVRKPVLHVGGQADPLVMLVYQQKTIATIRQLNGATGPGTSCGPDCTLYPSTPPGTPVETYLHPGGHDFPRETTGMIVKFFKEHPR